MDPLVLPTMAGTALVVLAAVWLGSRIAAERTAQVEARFDRLLGGVDAESRRKTDLLLAGDTHSFSMLRQASEPAPPPEKPSYMTDADEFAAWANGREVTYVDPNDLPVPAAD